MPDIVYRWAELKLSNHIEVVAKVARSLLRISCEVLLAALVQFAPETFEALLNSAQTHTRTAFSVTNFVNRNLWQ